MAAFVYTALKRDGTRATGEITASDKGEALRKLERNGLQPVSVKQKEEGALAVAAPAKAEKAEKSGKGGDAPVKEDGRAIMERSRQEAVAKKEAAAAAGKGTDKPVLPTGPVKLKRGEVIMFTEELSDLLGAGLQLEPALRIMESRDELSSVKTVTSMLRSKIRDGGSFSNALRSSSHSFGELYCNLAAAGEISGALPKILRRQAEYQVSVQNLQNKVTVAMIYPMFLMVAGIGVSALFVSYLIPQLTQLLKTMGKELPGPAKAAMAVGDIIKGWWWLIALVIGVSVWAFQRITSSPQYREAWDRQKLKLFFFGPLISQRFFVQFLETLANLVGNGLPLMRALELTRDATVNLHLKTLLGKVIGMVGEGGSLSRSLRKVGFFPSLLTDMITVGEQTGDIEHALERTAARYEKELQKTIDRGTALVTPLIIFIMAIIVGSMAYLMVSIILQSVTSIKR